MRRVEYWIVKAYYGGYSFGEAPVLAKFFKYEDAEKAILTVYQDEGPFEIVKVYI